MDSLLRLPGNENLSVKEQYKRIDKAIRTYRLSIKALKSQRNALAPISRLPPEIFCRIFLFTKAPIPSHNESIYPFEWIKVTHVSRHWRNIAINAPNLWADLPVRNFRWATEMLRRSKDASLIVKDFPGLSERLCSGLKLALKHGARIKDLCLLDPKSTFRSWDQLQRSLPVSAPRLESLIIQNGIADYQGYFSGPLESISIPEYVLCKTERLRHLELTNCDVNWNSHSHILHSLTHLKLHALSKTLRPTGQQFLDALNRMPHIEFLDLNDALPIPTCKEALWVSSHTIHFASLQTLNICSTNIEIEPFFSCITFPPTATVMVVVRSVTEAEDLSGIISNIARVYSDPSSAKTFQTIAMIPKCIFGDNRYSGYHLKLYANTLAHDEHVDLTPRLGLIFFWPETDGISANQGAADTLTDIFSSAIPLQHVEHVYMDERICGIDGEMLASTIGKLPRVRHVTAAHDSDAPFLDALQLQTHLRHTAISSVATVKPLYFASLSSVDLYRPNFVDSPLDCRPDSSLWAITIEMLQDCLIHRYEYGMEIRRLTLEDCAGFRQKDADLLAEIVVDVDWDGSVYIIGQEEEEEEEIWEEDESEYSDSVGEY